MSEGRQKRHLTYRDAGVDIDAGAALVEAIKPLAGATRRPGTAAALGGFGALFDLKAAGFHDPLLVATTDGVGTKLKLAIALGRHDTIGIDLVAMCVNDLVVQGATPLFFLDYYATGRLDVDVGRAIVSGIASACREVNCALIGGETAELPGLYAEQDYDLAGFAVGAVERDRVITGEGVVPGDLVLGLASSGFHSNGFSLVRRVVELSGLPLEGPAPFHANSSADAQSLGEALLTPTKLYVRVCLDMVAEGGVKAFAHITGGGLLENIPRVLPEGTGVSLDAACWSLPPAMAWLASTGGVRRAELARTFNAGIGMVAVCAPDRAAALVAAAEMAGERAAIIGEVVTFSEGRERVLLHNVDGWPE